jgi:uncharacterized protein with GYD domain
MAKFLIKASYTSQGTEGLLKEGGVGRRSAVEKTIQALGGKIDAFYFAFGEDDAFVICDLPDAVSAAALSLRVSASGRVHISTVPLLTPEDMDAACKKSITYRAPGA